MLIDASFTLVYLFLCCAHSPVASWHQVGGKRQDAVQSQDSRSINHICTGTAGLLFLFKYWCGYTAGGGGECSTGGHRRAWFMRKCFLKGTTEQKLKPFFLLGGTENPVSCEFKDWIWPTDDLVLWQECVLLWCNVSSPGSVSTQILPALPVDDLRRQPCRTYQIPEGAFPSNTLDI